MRERRPCDRSKCIPLSLWRLALLALRKASSIRLEEDSLDEVASTGRDGGGMVVLLGWVMSVKGGRCLVPSDDVTSMSGVG